MSNFLFFGLKTLFNRPVSFLGYLQDTQKNSPLRIYYKGIYCHKGIYYRKESTTEKNLYRVRIISATDNLSTDIQVLKSNDSVIRMVVWRVGVLLLLFCLNWGCRSQRQVLEDRNAKHERDLVWMLRDSVERKEREIEELRKELMRTREELAELQKEDWQLVVEYDREGVPDYATGQLPVVRKVWSGSRSRENKWLLTGEEWRSRGERVTEGVAGAKGSSALRDVKRSAAEERVKEERVPRGQLSLRGLLGGLGMLGLLGVLVVVARRLSRDGLYH